MLHYIWAVIPRCYKPEKVTHDRKSEQSAEENPHNKSPSEDTSTETVVKAIGTVPVVSTSLADEGDSSDSTFHDWIMDADSPAYSTSSGDDSSDCTSAAEVPLPSIPPHKERKFIVFQSCLDEMFVQYCCTKCGTCDMRRRQREVGTMILVIFTCASCGTERSWTSQPYCGSTPAGNILLSTAIVCAGTTISKVERVLRHMSVACITKRTFHRHQEEFILSPSRRGVARSAEMAPGWSGGIRKWPCTWRRWKSWQSWTFSEIRNVYNDGIKGEHCRRTSTLYK